MGCQTQFPEAAGRQHRVALEHVYELCLVVKSMEKIFGKITVAFFVYML